MVIYRINISGALIDVLARWQRPLNAVLFDWFIDDNLRALMECWRMRLYNAGCWFRPKVIQFEIIALGYWVMDGWVVKRSIAWDIDHGRSQQIRRPGVAAWTVKYRFTIICKFFGKRASQWNGSLRSPSQFFLPPQVDSEVITECIRRIVDVIFPRRFMAPRIWKNRSPIFECLLYLCLPL